MKFQSIMDSIKHLLKIRFIFLLFFFIITGMHSCNKITTPVIATQYVSEITQTSAISGGYIISSGGAKIYGKGICWSTTQNPTLESETEYARENDNSFILSMSDLLPGTTYYVRAYAFNSEGISFGNDISFNTSQISTPTLKTFNISLLTSTTANCYGSIINDGGSNIVEKGVCWDTSQNPEISGRHTSDGAGIKAFISTLSSLMPNITYYVRAYATNGAGTGYGNEVSFTLWLGYPGPSLTDIDGFNYKTVRIGTQLWMAENLGTTKLNDGTAIPNVTDLPAWAGLITPGYCWYNNHINSIDKTFMGALYNWYAVNTGKLCPSGWHVSSDDEWKILELYLGMTKEQAESSGNSFHPRGQDQAMQLRDSVTWYYTSYGENLKNINPNGTNSSGFSARPTLSRSGMSYIPGALYMTINSEGFYLDKGGLYSSFWTASDIDELYAWCRSVGKWEVSRGADQKNNGFGVRCIKDGK